MACAYPPELDDVQLLVYADGEADRRVAEHVAQCSYCRERAERLARLQRRLTATLYRVTCPPPEELGEYHLGLLPRGQMAAVTRHLDECPYCTQEVVQLKEYLSELAPALELRPLEWARERVKVLVARLVDRGQEPGRPGQPALAPAYAGIRGEEEEPYVYQAGDFQVVVEVQADTEHPDRWMILGLLVGLEDAQGTQVHVWQADAPLTTVTIDELGNFAIPDLELGTYELILSGPEVEIHIQHLEVTPRGRPSF